MTSARIALVGDRSQRVLAHGRIPVALEHCGVPVSATWVGSSDVRGPADLAGFDGVWLVPGSPYASRDGALAAVTAARTAGVPFLGTCGGFQHALLEIARNVCGMFVDHAEQPLDEGAEALIVPLSCSLVGAEATVVVRPGTLAATLLGAGPRVERFFCSYGLADRFVAALESAGLVFSAADADGSARIVELPGHPFFVASLFQPELSSDETSVHPLIRAFAGAVVEQAASAGRAASGT